MKSFIGLDEFRQLLECEESAIDHDTAIGNVTPQSVVSEGQLSMPLDQMTNRQQLANLLAEIAKCMEGVHH